MKTKTPESEIAKARKAIDALYTPLDEALELLRERRADEKLRAALADFNRAHPPNFLPSAPCAVLSRFVVTPNREFEHFIKRALGAGLFPLCLDHDQDIYTPINPEKYRLCRPRFEMAIDHFRVLHLPIKDFSRIHAGSHRLNELQLENGMSVCAFHRALRASITKNVVCGFHDFSNWFCIARTDGYFYLHHLALFIRDGILFENFLSDDPEELRFVREKLMPSFTKAMELFGMKPLVVSLLPRETENDEHWRAHPGALHSVAINLLNGGNKRREDIPI